MQSLAEYLGVAVHADVPAQPVECESVESFARQILTSPEYRASLFRRIILGELPAAVELRLLDYAWGKPTERIEHSGEVKLTKVVREIVDPVRDDQNALVH
jgi:hypothetical protein